MSPITNQRASPCLYTRHAGTALVAVPALPYRTGSLTITEALGSSHHHPPTHPTLAACSLRWACWRMRTSSSSEPTEASAWSTSR